MELHLVKSKRMMAFLKFLLLLHLSAITVHATESNTETEKEAKAIHNYRWEFDAAGRDGKDEVVAKLSGSICSSNGFTGASFLIEEAETKTLRGDPDFAPKLKTGSLRLTFDREDRLSVRSDDYSQSETRRMLQLFEYVYICLHILPPGDEENLCRLDDQLKLTGKKGKWFVKSEKFVPQDRELFWREKDQAFWWCKIQDGGASVVRIDLGPIDNKNPAEDLKRKLLEQHASARSCLAEVKDDNADVSIMNIRPKKEKKKGLRAGHCCPK